MYQCPYLQVSGELVLTLTVSQVYKYLGINISPQSTKAAIAEMLKQRLSNITKAPLKPKEAVYRQLSLGSQATPPAYYNTIIF